MCWPEVDAVIPVDPFNLLLGSIKIAQRLAVRNYNFKLSIIKKKKSRKEGRCSEYL